VASTRGGESRATPAGGGDPQFSQLWQEPTRQERRAVLESFQKRLEDRLAEVKDQLSKL
jgi:hypothetical protein